MKDLDPALCARLVAEAREDDAALPAEPWRNTVSPLRADVVATLSNGEKVVVARCNLTDDDATDREHSIAARIARTRNNQRAMADQLEASLSRITALETRQQELLELAAKLTRETPYPAELDECRSARRALIAEVGTLRARRAELEAEADTLYACIDELSAASKRGIDQLEQYIAARDRSIDALTARIWDLTTERDRAAEQRDEAHCRLVERRELMDSTVAALSSELDAAHQVTAAVAAERDALAAGLREADARHQAALAYEHGKATACVETQQRRVAELEAEVASLRWQILNHGSNP